jgi:hypothetical protein
VVNTRYYAVLTYIDSNLTGCHFAMGAETGVVAVDDRAVVSAYHACLYDRYRAFPPVHPCDSAIRPLLNFQPIRATS